MSREQIPSLRWDLKHIIHSSTVSCPPAQALGGLHPLALYFGVVVEICRPEDTRYEATRGQQWAMHGLVSPKALRGLGKWEYVVFTPRRIGLPITQHLDTVWQTPCPAKQFGRTNWRLSKNLGPVCLSPCLGRASLGR